MTTFQRLMVDELRREFRRICPPAYMIKPEYEACICEIARPERTGYLVVWKLNSTIIPLNQPIQRKTCTITILETLTWL
jgi:hypothetical protein